MSPREPRRHVVARAEDLPPGSRRIVKVGTRSIGVFNVDGELFALRNRCPHQGGPLCLGPTDGLATAKLNGNEPPEVVWERAGEIVRCPWHSWEFDLRTGEAVFGEGYRVRAYRAYVEPVETYRATIEGGDVVVEVP
jgi:nitrite reductase/ring-hydroxylating ferredoxin subunit